MDQQSSCAVRLAARIRWFVLAFGSYASSAHGANYRYGLHDYETVMCQESFELKEARACYLQREAETELISHKHNPIVG
jgi:hypothetical protein